MVNSLNERGSRKEVLRTSLPQPAQIPCSIVSTRVRGELVRRLRNFSISGDLFVAFMLYIIPYLGLWVKGGGGFIFNRRKCLSIKDLRFCPPGRTLMGIPSFVSDDIPYA